MLFKAYIHTIPSSFLYRHENCAEITVVMCELKPYTITNHNYNKIIKSDWLSTVLTSALIGQYASCLSILDSTRHHARAYDYRPNWTPVSPVTITSGLRAAQKLSGSV